MFDNIKANTHSREGGDMGTGYGSERNGNIYYVNIPVQMICAMDTTGRISPIRFRYETEGGEIETVQVARILERDEKHFVGLREKQYICAVEMYGRQRVVEFRYHVESQRWRLFRFLS